MKRPFPMWGIPIVLSTIAVAVLLVYSPVSRHGFSNLDDPLLISNNELVKKGLTRGGLQWAFFNATESNWYPLHWISHMASVSAFGLVAGWHHIVNLVIHMVNSMLLFVVFLKMTGAFYRSSALALLFAVHPVHVEAVAWITCRGDVLSMFFMLLALAAYGDYAARPGVRRLSVVTGAYACALLVKPIVVSFPLLLMLLDYWPLKRWRRGAFLPPHRLVVEKLPLFALAAAQSAITFALQKNSGAMKALSTFSPGIRIGNALVSYVKYIQKSLWPESLAVFYPHPGESLSLLAASVSGVVLAAISLYVLRRCGKQPYLATGWGWFMITLVPVIGFVQVGWQAMADRYSYISYIGLYIIVLWGLADFAKGRRYRSMAAAFLVVAVLPPLVLTARAQVHYWRSDIVLYERALAVTSRNAFVRYNLAVALSSKGKYAEAVEHFAEALRLRPDYEIGYVAMGRSLARLGRREEAIVAFSNALARVPDYFEAHFNLGILYARQGEGEKAITHFKEAILAEPLHGRAHHNLGALLLMCDRTEEARDHLTKALEVGYEPARENVAFLLRREGKFEELAELYREALKRDPASAQNHLQMGRALTSLGRVEEATSHYREALRLRPDLEEARDLL